MGNHGGGGGFLHWDSNVWPDWADALAYLNFLRLHKAQADLCPCWPHKSFEPVHDKTNKTTCAPSEDSDQPGHPPSLIRGFTVRMNKAWVFSYPLSTQRRLIRLGRCPGSSVFAEHATGHFVGFVMHWLISLRYVLYGLPMAKTFYRRTAKTVIRLGRMPRLNAQADLCLCWPHKSFEPVHD